MASPTPEASSPQLSLKLLVDTKEQRVLYAETSKDIVDFLFSLLTLPVGTVVKILSKGSVAGSIGNLYGSVEKLDATYVRSAEARSALLAPAGGYEGGKLLQLPQAASSSTGLYRCSNIRQAAKNHVDPDMVNKNTPAKKELSMKLWLDTATQRVCFAEAGNDVVDFLACLLSLPMCTIIHLLSKERVAGGIGNVYGSVEAMDTNYLLSPPSKEVYLKPTVLDTSVLSPLQELLDAPLNLNTYSFYTCEGMPELYARIKYPTCCGYFTGVKGELCPHCCLPMLQTIKHCKRNGFVAGKTAMYTVKDDLTIKSAASVSTSIALLVECGVQDLSLLQEKTVKIGNEEALEILLASLTSKTVLTDVFLRDQKVQSKKETRPDSEEVLAS